MSNDAGGYPMAGPPPPGYPPPGYPPPDYQGYQPPAYQGYPPRAATLRPVIPRPAIHRRQDTAARHPAMATQGAIRRLAILRRDTRLPGMRPDMVRRRLRRPSNRASFRCGR